MEFCTKCVTPDTRPDLVIDDEGVCDACRSAERKHGLTNAIDWDSRKQEFHQLLEKFRNSDPLRYDCVIPVSGGKDSHLTLYYALQAGLKPLCVVFEPTLPTEHGRKNLENISRQGVDVIYFKRNPLVYEMMIMEGFRRVGDMEWANHMGIWTVPVHIAINFDIPLILWGESPQLEYGGAETISDINSRVFDEDWLNDYGCLNGLRPQDLVGEKTGLSLSDMKMYVYPSKEAVAKWGGVGVFMGYYFKWNVPENFGLIESMGWRRTPGRIEISYTDHEKLDCESMLLHDYLKYLKFGYGRATDSASIDIRNGTISREEGVRLVEKYDTRYPKHAVERFSEHFGITRQEFDRTAEAFANKAIFKYENSAFQRDIDGSLIMKPQIVERRRSPYTAVDSGLSLGVAAESI